MAQKGKKNEEVEEEEGDEECPKCPPVGAPAWMATFADMATLLMAFFVLILSFAEFNVPKFKQISGSLKNAFGVQRIVPVVEQPKGTTVISLEFSPSPNPSVTKEMTQQTTEQERPEVEVKTKDQTSDSGDTKASQGDAEGSGGKQSASGEQSQSGSDPSKGNSTASSQAMNAAQLATAFQEAVNTGEIEVEINGQNMVVNFPSADTTETDLPSLIEQTMQALAEAREASGQADQEVLFGGLEQELAKLAAAAQENERNKGNAPTQKELLEQAKAEAAEMAAGTANDQLMAALQPEIQQGLVEVEKREGKIFITVGAGGAFPSGRAELTDSARDIMNRVAVVSMGAGSDITVTGHTDDVPISNGLYRDNWDLAAARASSVVQALQDTGMVTAGRMRAVSKGETEPVDSNETAAGREKNRRIEIEIDFEKEN